MTKTWQLPLDEVHVYIEALSAYQTSVELLRTWLTPEEQAQSSEFRFEKDRNRFIIGHALVRGILARYLDHLPMDVPILRQAGGKPVLDYAQLSERSRVLIGFNLSSCQTAVAIAVAPTECVGVDIEDRVRQVNPLEIAKTNFASIESRWLQEAEPGQRQSRFLSLWTCKEAFSKAVGLGMALPFNQFAVEFRNRQKPELVFVSDRFGQPFEWEFHSREFTPGVQLAVAIRMSRCRFELRKIDLLA